MQSNDLHGPGLSVNLHLIEACNARCAYCFATFPHLGRADRLSSADRMALVDLLVDAEARKINFAGGEPTLLPDLGALCERVKTRSGGRCAVSLVTNGARLRPLLEGWSACIDWVALSVDSGDDRTNETLGRTRKNRPYAPVMLELGAEAKRRGVRLKCNTVVSRANLEEDMTGFISALVPERWKLLQLLPVVGENDSSAGDFSVSEDAFRAFVERHRPLGRLGIELVPEDNDAMTNSYLMIGPDGRFFWHVQHGPDRALEYGDQVLKVGLDEALRQVRFSEARFRDRGGAYDWLPKGETRPCAR